MDNINKCDMVAAKPHLSHATPEGIRAAFTKYQRELEWLAYFLSGREDLATKCVTRALALAVTKTVFVYECEHCFRHAIILSALREQESRLIQLASIYQRHPCPHQDHGMLSAEEIVLLKTHPEDVVNRLDGLCRFALAMRGIDAYSPSQCGVILKVGRVAFDAAYCAAVESLKLIKYELLDVPG